MMTPAKRDSRSSLYVLIALWAFILMMFAGYQYMIVQGTPTKVETFPIVTRTITMMPEDIDRWDTGG